MSQQSSSKPAKGPLFWSLLIAGIGGLLLVGNFLLLGEFNIVNLLPLLLVVAGAQILLRGDIVPSDDTRTFRITRGSVESATLEINAGEIDIDVQALPPNESERLIAGQYAPQTRPDLYVDDTLHAHLQMQRQQTPWLSFADWEMGVSPAITWQIVVSSYLGHLSLDLSQLPIENALISSGVGDVHLVAPYDAYESLYVRSTLGSVHITAPPGVNLRVTVDGGRFFGRQVDETRYTVTGDNTYVAQNADDDAPLVDVVVSGTFGDVVLS